MRLKDELAKLSIELDELQSEQAEQRQNTQQRLSDFSDKLSRLSVLVSDDLSLNPSATTPAPGSLNSTVDNQLITEPSAPENAHAIQQPTSEDAQPGELPEFYAISGADSQRQISASLGGNLGEYFSASLGPFTAIGDQLKAFYNHYQAKGLGPVFLMTVAGIITLTLGFAYLFQYSINNWLSETGKAILVFASANTILGGALLLRKRRSDMEDFSLALVGLGLILNYLSTYFIGPYFQLVPNGVCFILLLVISLTGFALSIKLASKVISLIVLMGGSAVPLILVSGSHAPLLYLPYLLLIGCCALLQSRLLRWPLLLESTALLHIACIEIFIFHLGYPLLKLDWQSIAALLSINTIFYLYGFAGIYWLIKDQSLPDNDPQTDHEPQTGNEEGPGFSRRILAIPFALLAFVLLTFIQITFLSGEIFLINSLVCCIIGFSLKDQKSLRGLLLVFAGSFAGFAALFLISQDFLGLVLLLEGLLLLGLGVKEGYQSLRMEAYVLLALGLILNVSGLSDSLVSLDYDLYRFEQYGFILLTLLLSTIALLIASVMIGKLFSEEYSSVPSDVEYKVRIITKELLSYSSAASCLFISNLFISDNTTHLLPLLSLLLLYLAARDKLKLTELLAWIMILPLLGQVSYGMMISGSVSFGEQPSYAQFARIELFLSLLLAYYWYRRYFADSPIIKLVYWLQLLCFILLPLIFLPKVLRDFESYFSLALWGSCFISLLSARLLSNRILIFEAKLLTLAAFLITALSCIMELWQGFLALLIGALLMLTLIYRYSQMDKITQLVVRLPWRLSPFYFALVPAVAVQTLMQFWQGNWGIVAAVLCAYFVLLISRRPIPAALRSGFAIAYTLIFISAVTPLLIHSQLDFSLTTQSLLYSLSEALVLIILGKFIQAEGSAVRLYKARLSLSVLNSGWHILLALSYLLWSYQFSTVIAAPLSAILMVIHGSWLMFISLQVKQGKMIRLAGGLFVLTCAKVLLVDMASFEILQKVIAFMVIGAILLSVSFFYQKARNRLYQFH
jgi:hypothetical protein